MNLDLSVVDILSIAASFAATGWFIKTVLDKNRDKERFDEDDAREYFDEHGRWPDESPEQVEARAARAADDERRARAEERDL